MSRKIMLDSCCIYAPVVQIHAFKLASLAVALVAPELYRAIADSKRVLATGVLVTESVPCWWDLCDQIVHRLGALLLSIHEANACAGGLLDPLCKQGVADARCPCSDQLDLHMLVVCFVKDPPQKHCP